MSDKTKRPTITGSPDATKTQLRSGALGLIGLTTLGAVMMSPALGVYGNWGPIGALVGSPTPLIFLAALAVTLPTAISYALICRELPSTGSAFAWVRLTMNRGLGNWIGLIMAIYYLIAALIQPIFFGLFLNDLLRFCGVTSPGLPTLVVGLLLVTAVGAALTYRGIQQSTRTAVIFVTIEILTVLALSATILLVQGNAGKLSLEPFKPAAITGGQNAFFQAMILGVFSFTGFDVISTVAEEAKAPRRLLPQATLLATVAVGLFWALNSYVFSISVPVSKVQQLAGSGLTAATPIADKFWGPGRVVVIATALTAVTAVYIATVTGASRALFALGRQGVLPRCLGGLHARHRTPWAALHATFALSLIGGIGAIVVLRNGLDAFVWWANSLSFFALVTYIGVNGAVIAYFARQARARFNPFLHGILPVVGIALDAYLIYRGFFHSLWNAGWRTGRSVVVYGLILAALAALWTVYVKVGRRDDLTTDRVGEELAAETVH